MNHSTVSVVVNVVQIGRILSPTTEDFKAEIVALEFSWNGREPFRVDIPTRQKLSCALAPGFVAKLATTVTILRDQFNAWTCEHRALLGGRWIARPPRMAEWPTALYEYRVKL